MSAKNFNVWWKTNSCLYDQKISEEIAYVIWVAALDTIEMEAYKLMLSPNKKSGVRNFNIWWESKNYLYNNISENVAHSIWTAVIEIIELELYKIKLSTKG